MANQRRENAIKKHKLALEAKKQKAELILHKKELKIAFDAQKKAENDEKDRLMHFQREIIRFSSFFVCTNRLFSLFQAKNAEISSKNRHLQAAILLQRCYRKVRLTVHPKKLMQERGIQHFFLMRGLIGPELASKFRLKLYKSIKDQYNLRKIGSFVENFRRKGENYTVLVVQNGWKRYKMVKMGRIERLRAVFEAAIAQFQQETVKPPSKRAKKVIKVAVSPYKRVDFGPIGEEILRNAGENYVKQVKNYEKSSNSPFPQFNYLISVDEMKALIAVKEENSREKHE